LYLVVVILIAAFFMAGTASAEEKATEAKVAKIVFVDKENCCKCTADRTGKSWTALQAALKEHGAEVAVERVHLDTQTEQAAPFKAMKPMIAIPAIYFLNSEGKLVEMLQGEVKQEQIGNLL
jgi:hypothetical protein